MKTQLMKILGLLVIGLFVLIQLGCEEKTEDEKFDVKLATSTTLGQYLVDSEGRTLYYFSNDYKGRTTCAGGCLDAWPVFNLPDLTKAKLGAGLILSDFDTINVGGTIQVRYKTWPLYYYAPVVNNVNVKEAPGQTSGEGVNGLWFVAKPDYSIMLVNAQLVGSNGKNYTSTYVEGTGKTIYFTDGEGITLYAYSKDSLNHNKFTKPDFSNNASWPLYETSSMVVPSTLTKTLFDTINVYGRTQLTYKGWPIYYFGADGMVRGNNKGVSVPTPGIWPVMVKDIATAPGK